MGKDELWERGGCRTRVTDLVLDCWWRGCFLTWLVVGSGVSKAGAVPLPGFWGNWLSSPRAGVGLLMGGAGTQGFPGLVSAQSADKARHCSLPPPGFSVAVPWEFQIWCQPTGGWCWILDAKGHKVSRTDTSLVVCRARA